MANPADKSKNFGNEAQGKQPPAKENNENRRAQNVDQERNNQSQQKTK